MTYAVELPSVGPEDWAVFERSLAVRIKALAPGEDVTVSVPSMARPHKAGKGRFFGLIPAKYVDVAPWVRVRRDADHAVAEAVGSEIFGGTYVTSEDEEAAIEALGWRRPGPPSLEERVWSRWYPDDVAVTGYLAKSDAQAAAALATRTLREVFSEFPG